MGHRIFITGAAGYIGGMLCELLSQRADVERILALDEKPMPEALLGLAKIQWIAASTHDPSWRTIVAAGQPDIIIHTAWQIRDSYSEPLLQLQRNVGGSLQVFSFAFTTPGVRRLVHMSTVSCYGAQADTGMERRFSEKDRLRPSISAYAEEKREAEHLLESQFAMAREAGSTVSVAVLRPAAITGPRGRSRHGLLGLQTALSGQLKGNAIHRIVRLLTSYVPVTKKWCRQFIHEDDIADIIALASFAPLRSGYEILNAAPPGKAVQPADIAKAFRKRLMLINPQFIRLAFALAWHGTRGRIPTSRGTWKFYSYPIVVDGSKVTKAYGYKYRMDSKAAFTRDSGRYAGLTSLTPDRLARAGSEPSPAAMPAPAQSPRRRNNNWSPAGQDAAQKVRQ